MAGSERCTRQLAVTSLCYQIVLTVLVVFVGSYLWQLKNEVNELAAYRMKEAKSQTQQVNGQNSTEKVEIERRQVDVPSWVTGPTGPPGRDGRDGIPGPQGPPGLPGKDAVSLPAIDQHINFVIGDIVRKERERLREAVRTIPRASGAVYVRWGRTSCPTESSMVYKGKAGGSYYSSGGGTNIQCLPEDASYLNTSIATQSRIYGVEYQVYNRQHFSSAKNLGNKNMPCIVCQAKFRSSALMMPATTGCLDKSWTLEYQGYLMSGGTGNRRSTFVCVDKDAEATAGQDDNRDGELLYHTTVDCHNFGYCPPYKNNAELACAVCSK